MNGVTRNVLADVAKKGVTGEDALKEAMSPDAMRSETGTEAGE